MSWKPHILARLQSVWGSRTEPENMRSLAAAYWQLLVLAGVVVTILILVLAVQELDFVVQAQNLPPPAQAGGGPSIDRVQLESTLAQYANRDVQYRAVASSSPSAIPDPSK